MSGRKNYGVFSNQLAMAEADLLKSRREAILQVARGDGVGRIGVFGSYARGDAGEGSDLDLLIEIEGPTTPWFSGGLVAELEALLGCRVDVVEREALRVERRAQALAEAVPLRGMTRSTFAHPGVPGCHCQLRCGEACFLSR
jgi:uncharacterized protein